MMCAENKIIFGPSGDEDRRQARALWEEMFPEDSVSFLNYYEACKLPENGLVLRRMDGQAVSMLQWNPVTLSRGEDRWPSAYLIAVATRPEYRHRGLMAGLLRDGLNQLAGEDMPFVFLMPADPAIYLPFGFRYIYDRSVLVRRIEQKKRDGAGRSQLRCRRIEPEEYKRTAEWMEQVLHRAFSIYQARDEKYLEIAARECGSEGGGIYGIFRGEELMAEFSFWEEDGPSVRELLTLGELTEEILQALDDFFSARGEYHAVLMHGGEKEAIIMGRIASLKAFAGGFRTEEEASLLLEVRDPLIPANDGVFCWKLGPGESRLLPSKARPEFSCSIDELVSALLSGREEEPELRLLAKTADGKRVPIEPLQGIFLPEIV